MAAASDNIHDVFIWIKKIIYSSTNWKQLNAADNLIEIFLDKYKDEQMYRELCFHYLIQLDNI